MDKNIFIFIRALVIAGYNTVHKLCLTMDSNREIRHSAMYILRTYKRGAFLTQVEARLLGVCMLRVCMCAYMRENLSRESTRRLYYTWYKHSSCISAAEKLVLSLGATRATRCRSVNGAVVLHVVCYREAREQRRYNLEEYGASTGWISSCRGKNIKERRVVHSNE